MKKKHCFRSKRKLDHKHQNKELEKLNESVGLSKEDLEIFVKAIECEVAQPPVDSEENKKLLEKELILFRDLPF